MRLLISALLLSAVSCQFVDKVKAPHDHDGLYVGVTMMGVVGYVVNGNEVTIYHAGAAKKEPIEYGDGYFKLTSNGAILNIETDEDTGEKSLVFKGPFMNSNLAFVTSKTDIPENKINELIAKAVRSER